METFLIRALQLIMSLSLLVIVHEGGHFLFARLFKTRVEKFCLFFDPWFTLFKFKPKHSDTEYGIGWLPLGGYVKIAGRRIYGYRTDEATHAAMGVPCQAGMAAPANYGRRCIVQLPARIVHLFHDTFYLGRRIYTSTKSPIGYGF